MFRGLKTKGRMYCRISNYQPSCHVMTYQTSTLMSCQPLVQPSTSSAAVGNLFCSSYILDVLGELSLRVARVCRGKGAVVLYCVDISIDS